MTPINLSCPSVTHCLLIELGHSKISPPTLTSLFLMWCAVSSLCIILLIKTNSETLLYSCITLGKRFCHCMTRAVKPFGSGTSYKGYSVPIGDSGGFCIHSRNYCSLYFGFATTWVTICLEMMKVLLPTIQHDRINNTVWKRSFLGGDIHMLVPLSWSTGILALITGSQHLFGRIPFIFCYAWQQCPDSILLELRAIK